MRRHQILFWSISSFLVGVIAAGLGLTVIQSALLLILAIPFAYRFKPDRITFLAAAVLFLAGSLYYAFTDFTYYQKQKEVSELDSFEGIVVNEPRRRLDNQSVKLEVDSAFVVLVYLSSYPEVSYGDIIKINGKVDLPPEDSYGRYLYANGIHGVVYYPKVEIVDNEANPFFATLYGIRDRIKDILGELFNYHQSAFLAGIMLGDRDEFSKEFVDRLSISGTLHLTALSGQHIVIIISMATALFTWLFFFRRRAVFVAVIILIFLFVAMTGFTASAVRAALMGFIASLALQAGRIHSPRNSIALAAFLIALHNPRAPVFDLGLQLSFAATMGIIYISPILKRIAFFEKDGVLNWRTMLAMTIAAQIAVTPITIINFANFSFTGLLANIGVLVIMPFLVPFAFITVAAAAIFLPLGMLFARLNAFLIDYATLVIEFFSEARLLFNPAWGWGAALVYYIGLVILGWRFYPRIPTHTHKPT